MKKVLVSTVITVMLFLSSPLAEAQSDLSWESQEEPEYPNFIDWAKIREFTLFDYQYDWMENSAMVAWLQYLLGIEPMDGIYGPRTHIQHRQITMQEGRYITTYDFVIQDRDFGPNVERWRSSVSAAIARYGGPQSDVPRFLQVMKCESGGLPDAYNETSGASGLMQHLQVYWDNRARVALGYEGASPFDPEANINTSAWLIYRATSGGWQHWVCQ